MARIVHVIDKKVQGLCHQVNRLGWNSLHSMLSFLHTKYMYIASISVTIASHYHCTESIHLFLRCRYTPGDGYMTRVTYFLMGPWVSSSENSKFLRMFDSTTSSSLAANSCPIQFLKWACVEGVMLIYKSIL